MDLNYALLVDPPDSSSELLFFKETLRLDILWDIGNPSSSKLVILSPSVEVSVWKTVELLEGLHDFLRPLDPNGERLRLLFLVGVVVFVCPGLVGDLRVSQAFSEVEFSSILSLIEVEALRAVPVGTVDSESKQVFVVGV